MSLRVRLAEAADAEAVRAVLTSAFPTPAEADLVERLAADGDLAFGFAAVLDGLVIGYAGFSRMKAEADGDPVAALALAPLAVRPSHQHRGVGGRLIECGLAAANGRGTNIVFVLGNSDYYGRHGFSVGAAAPFRSDYSGAHFAAQWLSSPRSPTDGRADYPPAFASL
jgi:putative acetyltransferase